MQPDSPSPRILVVGANKVGKQTLISRLVPDQAATSSSITPHLLDTRYYTAQVDFVKASAQTTGVEHSFEALVLVVDVTQEVSFTAVQQWRAQVDTSQVGVLLCVANKADQLEGDGHPGSRRADWLDACQEWCISHLIEYVEVSAGDAGYDRRLAAGDDCQGVARVKAALETHSWPNLIMKQQRLSADNEPLTSRPGQVDLASTNSNSLGAERTRPSSRRANGPQLVNPPVATAAEDGPATLDLEEDTEDPTTAEMDRMFLQLAEVRSQMPDLSDEQRRDRAAEMATRMMSLFGISDTDSEEDDP